MVTKCRLARSTPDERRDTILAVAAQAFARKGYGATSMSAIAALLGGSKATLYKYFPSKEHLFEAMVGQRCQQALASLRDMRSTDCEELEALLARFGEHFLMRIYEPGALAMHRLIHSEGARFPELAGTFFRSGPDALIDELATTLAGFVARGAIVCDDPVLAAGQFLGMVRGDRHLRFAMGLLPAPDHAEIARHARFAARIFARGLLPQ